MYSVISIIDVEKAQANLAICIYIACGAIHTYLIVHGFVVCSVFACVY